MQAQICPAAAGYTQTRALDAQLEADQVPHFAGVAEFRFVDPGAALAFADKRSAIAPLLAPDARVVAVVTGVDHVDARGAARGQHALGGLEPGPGEVQVMNRPVRPASPWNEQGRRVGLTDRTIREIPRP